jgi:hypothetical protein
VQPWDCICTKISSGLLPSQPPRKSWAGFGSGQLCDVCDQPILASEIEHEVDFENYPPHRFHATCLKIWTVVVAQTTQPATSEGA